jgi:hypothetical protein
MSDDKAKKEQEKLEKKRAKAQLKLEKKQGKQQPPLSKSPESKEQIREPDSRIGSDARSSEPTEKIKEPWYKNPDWIRAIIGIASLIVAIVTLYVALR